MNLFLQDVIFKIKMNAYDITIAAMKDDGYALEDATPELRADREIVLSAVQQSPRSLTYAIDGPKNDIKILQTALKGEGYAM